MGVKWQIQAKGFDGKTTFINDVDENSTVDDFMKKLQEYNGIPINEQRVIFGNKQLELGRTLKSYGMDDNCTVAIVLRLKGGFDTCGKKLPPGVERSYDPDMITWDDSPDNERAKMPCGHAISPDSLTYFCKSILESGKSRFFCPYINPHSKRQCRVEWQFIEIRHIAGLTQKEKETFDTMISDNYLRRSMGIQECPECHSYCERIGKDRRVVCPLCTKRKSRSYDFCWYCLHEWKTGGTTSCGNSGCSGDDPRLKILRECPTKEVVGVHGCPSRRACPKCGMLIEHERDCKHMACRCGQRFCFICLKTPINGSYQCGSYNSKCAIAPIQTVIPGAD